MRVAIAIAAVLLLAGCGVSTTTNLQMQPSPVVTVSVTAPTSNENELKAVVAEAVRSVYRDLVVTVKGSGYALLMRSTTVASKVEGVLQKIISEKCQPASKGIDNAQKIIRLLNEAASLFGTHEYTETITCKPNSQQDN